MKPPRFTLSTIPRFIIHHLHDESHTHQHRMTVGCIVMAVGVYIASLASYVEYHVIHYLLDGIGYGIHGLGLSPFLDIWVKVYFEE